MPKETNNSQKKTISINIPKLTLPSVQSFILIMLIIVGLLQTAQLIGLDAKIASANVGATSTSSTSSASSSGSVTSSLPSMVGGC